MLLRSEKPRSKPMPWFGDSAEENLSVRNPWEKIKTKPHVHVLETDNIHQLQNIYVHLLLQDVGSGKKALLLPFAVTPVSTTQCPLMGHRPAVIPPVTFRPRTRRRHHRSLDAVPEANAVAACVRKSAACKGSGCSESFAGGEVRGRRGGKRKPVSSSLTSTCIQALNAQLLYASIHACIQLLHA